jgi:hypothetical protein
MGAEASDRIAEIFAQKVRAGKVACNSAKTIYEAKIR